MFLFGTVHIAYRSGERRIHVGDESTPGYRISASALKMPISISPSFSPPPNLRAQIRSTPEGRRWKRVPP